MRTLRTPLKAWARADGALLLPDSAAESLITARPGRRSLPPRRADGPRPSTTSITPVRTGAWASVNDPTTWSAEAARPAHPRLSSGDGVGCIDLDAAWTRTASSMRRRGLLLAYYEGSHKISPSDGARTSGAAAAPRRLQARVERPADRVYSTGRYITITGNVPAGSALPPVTNALTLMLRSPRSVSTKSAPWVPQTCTNSKPTALDADGVQAVRSPVGVSQSLGC